MRGLECLWVSMIMAGILVLSGCEPAPGSAAYNSMLRNPPVAQVKGGPTSGSTLGPSFQKAGTIPADKAAIYIYRPAGHSGFAAGWDADVGIPFDVKIDGKVEMTLVKGGYYVHLTQPGQIEFTAFDTGFMAPSSPFSTTLDAKAGQPYYLKGAHGKGLAGRAHLELVSPEVGSNEIANCKLITKP